MEFAVSLGTKPPKAVAPAPAPVPPVDQAAPAGGFGRRGPDLLPLDAGEQYRFGFDMGACIGCHSCEVACAEQNGLPAGTAWRRVGEVEAGAHPDTSRFHLSMSCNHCLDPACLEGCPTDAYVKLANGVVDHHPDDCVGCGYCTWTCPYSVPAIQPDRRVATKCDMCRPRLEDGFAPACVSACPTHAITVEKVDVAAWRADHRAGDAPHLPDAGLTVSTTRITLPGGLAADGATAAADDWDLRPEGPHWPLLWLTLVSQAALGVSVRAAAGASAGARGVAAVLAVAALVGALFHLGRPAAAWKAMRNLRTSWLSREVAALSLYAGVAAAAVPVPGLAGPAALAGAAGVFASARLYLVPGRPAWDSRLTIARFFATAAVLGPAALGHPLVAAGAAVAGLAIEGLNTWRLSRRRERAWLGPVRLAWGRLRQASVARVAVTAAGAGLALAGGPSPVVAGLLAAGELAGRWLFYVTVVPLDMPGAFRRTRPGAHR